MEKPEKKNKRHLLQNQISPHLSISLTNQHKQTKTISILSNEMKCYGSTVILLVYNNEII